jgi:hypothetical protein
MLHGRSAALSRGRSAWPNKPRAPAGQAADHTWAHRPRLSSPNCALEQAHSMSHSWWARSPASWQRSNQPWPQGLVRKQSWAQRSIKPSPPASPTRLVCSNSYCQTPELNIIMRLWAISSGDLSHIRETKLIASLQVRTSNATQLCNQEPQIPLENGGFSLGRDSAPWY